MDSVKSFAQRCGIDNAARQLAVDHLLRHIKKSGVERMRFAWCDPHGLLRGKTLMASAVERALNDGIGMVSTLMLKDTSDRTAWKVFEHGGVADLPGFEAAGNLILMADPTSYKQLPWAAKTGWVQCQPWHADGTPVAVDTRRVLQAALARLHARGYAMRCGLEVEFHIYKLNDKGLKDVLDPQQAAWPGAAPQVEMIHPGYNLLSEAWADISDAPLQIVQHTAQALGLPLTSLEIELGPSQVEAVFDVTDALTAADNMVLFRNATAQALRRAGYHATFMCRPPFPNIMSSGWHLHQSLVDAQTGHNLFMRETPAPATTAQDAQFSLSDIGEQCLAGLLAHARGMALLSTPTINGYERFQPNAMAPQSIVWGYDNRGAMLRVIGQAGDAATRIENRIGESAANPYLYLASQIHAGLDGIDRQLKAPVASGTPYEAHHARLPTTMAEAIEALKSDAGLTAGLGLDFVNYYTHIKQAELARWTAADDKLGWVAREYFARF
jgi:glutamine synthetase